MSCREVARAHRVLEQKLGKTDPGHDLSHAHRVHRTAKALLEDQQADPIVVEVAALLHDVWDTKFHSDDDQMRNDICETLLSIGLDPDRQQQIQEIISNISFRGGGVPDRRLSTEGEIVRDADRLDALGAIGIARAFSYAGYTNAPLYARETPRPHMKESQHRSSTSSAATHFYEKLLLLKQRMSTPRAKKEAERRHAFMLQFLTEFYREIGEPLPQCLKDLSEG